MESTLLKKRYFIIFLLPTLIAFTFSFIAPFIMGLYLSFCEFTTVTNAKWVGFTNYIKVFTNKDFINALFFTGKFVVVGVIVINLCAFALALLLTQKIRGRNLFRTVFFMPNLIGGIVLGYIWQNMINFILVKFETTLVIDPTYGFWGLVVMMNWQMIGYMMIIYIAGLTNVPTDLIEAAKIDGATKVQTLFNIKLPMVMSSITICLFLTISNCFKLFDQNLALTGGAPSKRTAMLALDIYNTFYGRSGYEGVGQAKAVVFAILVSVIALLQLWITRTKEVEHE